MKEGFPKLNYEYAAQLLTNINLRNEFFDWIGSNIKERLSKKHSIINEIVKFCSQRVYSLPINNKENCIEMSFDSINHLIRYVNDYNYSTSDELEKKKYRKGEIRDTFSTINSKTDAINTDIFKINNKQDSKIKIKFDIDKNKADWLDKEIKRNGGDKDIMIAIQVVLQKNQKAFLRSWGT